ncbi:MAG: hypothetical protein KDA27_16695 [Candidatus Eisenbacteria bacterium]|uniref:Uncharacterized protein n=1 Tax=Eiseniibacteriota bacterium TaxID=2212470 RepID=A0A956SEE3_UNCEI|nr:hypothetical protein [Candidatus Eisenbacteria bacterium]MCB9462846.1 hypothetical protein [Candidatus Eisenbacteria bacterium]
MLRRGIVHSATLVVLGLVVVGTSGCGTVAGYYLGAALDGGIPREVGPDGLAVDEGELLTVTTTDGEVVRGKYHGLVSEPDSALCLVIGETNDVFSRTEPRTIVIDKDEIQSIEAPRNFLRYVGVATGLAVDGLIILPAVTSLDPLWTTTPN